MDNTNGVNNPLGDSNAFVGTTNTGTLTVAPAIAIANTNLDVGTTSASLGTVTLTGGVTGTGNVVLSAAGSGAITFNTSAINNTGIITNQGAGTGTATFIAGANVTGITQNSASSILALSALTVNTGGTTLTVGSGGTTMTVGTVSGTGNLIFDNNSSTVGGITSGSSINTTGTIINSGTGSGSVTFKSVSSGVTTITQNSASSILNFSGTDTVNSSGTTWIDNSTGAATLLGNSTNGTGNLILENNTSTTKGIYLDNNVDNAGLIINQGTGSGSAQVETVGSAVTGLTENSNTSPLVETSGKTMSVNAGGTTVTNNADGSSTAATITLCAVGGTGNLILDNDSTINGGITFVVSTNNGIDNAGAIINSGTGSGSVTTGTGYGIGSAVTNVTEDSATSTLSLTSPNPNFVGTVTVAAGTLQIHNASALSASNVVTVNTGTFDMNGNAQTIAGLTGSGGSVTNSAASPKILTLGGAGSYSYAGAISAATPADMALSISGGGTQTLTGVSTYTGATNVTNGSTLALGNGGGLGATATVVASGAGLSIVPASNGVSNTLAGTVNLNAGANFSMADLATSTFDITGGSSTGLTIGTTSGSTVELTFDLGTTAGDEINVTHGIIIGASGGTINIDALPGDTSLASQYVLITAGSTATGYGYLNLNPSDAMITVGSNQYALSLQTSGNEEVLDVNTIVPEPSTLALLGGAIGMLMYRRRRSEPAALNA